MSMERPRTQVLGYPRVGEHRELKKAVEAYWKNELSQADLLAVAKSIRKENWQTQQKAGVDIIPSNDFSLYDHVLDTSCMVGNVPPRFKWAGEGLVDLNIYFAIARGVSKVGSTTSCPASDMTKWFDTNYHYIVPEFHSATKFKLSSSKIFDEFLEAKDLGIVTKPVLVGPVTYLTLGKVHDDRCPNFDRFSLLDDLIAVYAEVLQKLATLGAQWVQIDEPVFAQDLTPVQKLALSRTYAYLNSKIPSSMKIMVATYFGPLEEHLPDFVHLPVSALHIDVTRSPGAELLDVARALQAEGNVKMLSCGVIDGRNIWRSDLGKALSQVREVLSLLGVDRAIIATSCSLLHSPVTVRNEKKLDREIRSWLAFAEEKLCELSILAGALQGDVKATERLVENDRILQSRQTSSRVSRPEVQTRLKQVTAKDSQRHSTFAVRQLAQRERLKLPLLPTTTIGSFPQTQEVRSARAQLKSKKLSVEAYDLFIENQIKHAVSIEEEIGLDMLVHGEFERNDMVEYFGEHLEGYAFTENGWVQSYGSRCVKPPIIYGDVVRPFAMTVHWSSFAQSLTSRVVKGMLSGPITMLQWSFVRNDQPRKLTAQQIALALRDEVTDLEDAGIAAIQIDEPAIREGLPLRRKNWQEYLDWAVEAFRLTASGVRDDTQIHTHMCYSEFNDIIPSIAALDADVITIETSRSKMELLSAFVDFKYAQEIGPGVYDIHSPRVPHLEEMQALMESAIKVLPLQNLWVNPDCGLKTRGWPEVKEALTNMVQCARNLRAKYAQESDVMKKKVKC